MALRSIQDVVILGAGNMASHLGWELVKQGIKVAEVYNRTPGTGKELAVKLGANFIADIRAITNLADLYILAVADSAIAPLVELLRLNDKLVVHTSGTMEMKILSPVSENIGVFYPLQTFSPGRTTEFRGIPVCVETNTGQGKQQLEDLATRLKSIVYFIDSDNRKLLHLSAVFASNFTNFMYTVAEDLVLSNGIPFELLKPLISQTAENVSRGHVFQHQTGPAFRNDHLVMARHRELMANHPDYLEIYDIISKNIIKYKTIHGKL